MPVIQETFLEIEWGGEEEARQARDERADQLQAQGLVCTRENLYNVYGYRVFTLEATETTLVEPSSDFRGDRSNPSRPSRDSRPVRKFDRR